MNDYGFDYLNYIGNVPGGMNYNNPKITKNYMKNNNFKMSSMFPDMMGDVQLVDPREGLERGNLFKNLYDPYKDYPYDKLQPMDEKEALRYQIMQYKFALMDLNLYLDMHPNDVTMASLYQKYLEIEKQMCTNYENLYGPLTVDSEIVANGGWNWNSKPWPWEVK